MFFLGNISASDVPGQFFTDSRMLDKYQALYFSRLKATSGVYLSVAKGALIYAAYPAGQPLFFGMKLARVDAQTRLSDGK
jgi:hypothetical protein